MGKIVQIPLTRIRRQGAEIFACVRYRREEVVVTTYGKPIARIVSIEEENARLPRRGEKTNLANIGSDFDAFLREEGIFEDVSQAARERVIKWLRSRQKRRSIAFYEDRARKAGLKSLIAPTEIPTGVKVTNRNRHRMKKTETTVGRGR